MPGVDGRCGSGEMKIHRSLSELKALLGIAEEQLAHRAATLGGEEMAVTDADIKLWNEVNELRAEIARVSGLVAPQMPTVLVPYRMIVSSEAWRRGVADFDAGVELPVVWMRGSVWNYERGRQYAAWCRSQGRPPLPVFVDGKASLAARRRGRRESVVRELMELNHLLVVEVTRLFEAGVLL